MAIDTDKRSVGANGDGRIQVWKDEDGYESWKNTKEGSCADSEILNN